MSLEDLQKSWNSQEAQPILTIEPDILLKEVQRNKRSFEATVFWRDVKEVGIAFLMTAFFLYVGITENAWPLVVLAILVLFVGVFLLVDHILQRGKKPALTGPLLECIEGSLRQVNHQIWLLKNVLWWYLLPPGVGIGIFIIYCAWETIWNIVKWNIVAKEFVGILGSFLGYSVFCVLLFWGIYWLNQRCVRKELQPRRQELETLLDNLKNVSERNAEK
jgi:hypothetical protein